MELGGLRLSQLIKLGAAGNGIRDREVRAIPVGGRGRSLEDEVATLLASPKIICSES